MPKFVSLEGLHGVGKSTISQLIANELGVDLTPTIPKAFTASRRHVSEGSSLEARYMLFLSATLSAGEEIEEKLKNGTDVVVESYVFRTIAFHEGMGSRLKITLPKELFLPTHTILLTCNPQIRAKRLEERGGSRSRWDISAEAAQEGILERYAQFGFPEVDTTDSNPQQVANKVMEVINANA